MSKLFIYGILFFYFTFIMSYKTNLIKSIELSNTNDILYVINFTIEVKNNLRKYIDDFTIKKNITEPKFNIDNYLLTIQLELMELINKTVKITDESLQLQFYKTLKIFDKNIFKSDLLFRLIQDSLRVIQNKFNYIDRFVILYMNILDKINQNDLKKYLFNSYDYHYNLLLSDGQEDNFYDNFCSAIFTITDIINNTINNINLCNISITLQRKIYNYNRLLIQKSIQDFILSSYGWTLKSISEDSLADWDSNSNNNTLSYIQKIFIDSFRSHLDFMKNTIQNLPSSTSTCEPNYYEEDKTYYEFTKMFNVFIESEKDLSIGRMCGINCNISHDMFPYNKWYGYRKKCEKLLGCRYVSRKMEICLSDNVNKDILWFLDDKGLIYGTYNTCLNGTMRIVEEYTRRQSNCNYCVCTCKSKRSLSPRYAVMDISFREQIADLYNNMVVVGVKFTKEDRMIHIQIKQGKLMADGIIDESTIFWKPLEKLEYIKKSDCYVVRNDNGTEMPLNYGDDYGSPMMINLDNIIAPKGYVVTGVRLKFINNWNIATDENSTELQLQITPFNFATGQLIDLLASQWIATSTKMVNGQLQTGLDQSPPREELVLYKPDNPIKWHSNTIDSTDNQFIRFQASNLKKDIGQSTVPFFDAQPVAGEPSFPLSGVGLLHRGHRGYGGFLYFQIFDLNLYEYVETYE